MKRAYGRRARAGRALVRAALVTIGLGAGCEPAPGRDADMATEQTIQAGQWRKSVRTACSADYPDELVLRANGLYTGRTDPPGTYTRWDAGTWKVTGPGRVEISTANDAIVSYAFTVSGDTLRFRDPEGCDVEYVRISGAQAASS